MYTRPTPRRTGSSTSQPVSTLRSEIEFFLITIFFFLLCVLFLINSVYYFIFRVVLDVEVVVVVFLRAMPVIDITRSIGVHILIDKVLIRLIITHLLLWLMLLQFGSLGFIFIFLIILIIFLIIAIVPQFLILLIEVTLLEL